jgi:DNA-directed RNA polymerase subunit H
MSLNNSSKLISNIYNSRKNLIKQLDYQGYNTGEYNIYSINEINSMYVSDQLDMIFEKNEINVDKNIKEKVYIQYNLKKAISKNDIQKLVDKIFNLQEVLLKHDTLYIIVKEEVNDSITNMLKYMYDKYNIFVIIQNLTRLQFNILEHSLVPQHRLLNNQEIEEIKLRYNITNNNQFPKISRFDPVSLAIGLRPNDICEIKRDSKTTIVNLYYRICENI